jgi:tetratricopeptide (TPR) repeat protein
MDIKREYAAAFELAATGRYKEARTNLLEILQRQPGYIDALLLLAKVQYYLKQYRDSRKCFEMVLTYEPGNFAAYCGLEYYNQRTRNIRFYIVMTAAFIFFSAAVGILYFSLKGVFFEELGVLRQTVTRQSLQMEKMKEFISKTGQQRDKELLNNLEQIARQVSGKIETISSFLDSINKRIKWLNAEISILKREQRKLLESLKLYLKSKILPENGRILKN